MVVNLSDEIKTTKFEQVYKKYLPLFGKRNIQNNVIVLNPYQVAVFEIK